MNVTMPASRLATRDPESPVRPTTPARPDTLVRHLSAVCGCSDTQDVDELLLHAHETPDERHAAQVRDRVTALNLGLATSVAHRFTGRGIDTDDLVQVARLGLVKAVRGYRPGAGPGFTAYAVPTISGELKRHFRDCGWMIRPPRRLQEQRAAVIAVEADLLQSLGDAPSERDIARTAGLSDQELREVRRGQSGYRVASLDAPAPGEDRTMDPPDESDPLDRLEWRHTLAAAVSHLDERQQRIVRLRFEDELTQAEIGRQLGVSQMQVSRLLSAILVDLQTRLRQNGIDGYAETA